MVKVMNDTKIEAAETKKMMNQIVENQLSQMSVREKLGQCVMIEPCFCLQELNDNDDDEHYDSITDPRFLDKLLNDYHIGLFLFGGVSRIGDDSPEAWVTYFNEVNEFVKNTSSKLPLLYGVDAVHGVNFIQGSTIFPHNLGVAATWNPELASAYTAYVGEELSAIGINVNFAPTVDVARDQRWGRVYESLGEDPYLASVMSGALIRGMQSNGKVAACAKHFIGYGESSNGMDRTPANLSERGIYETHLPPFRAAVKEDVLAIMVNGGDVNGLPMTASRRLMTNMLREEMGFDGVTMSDWEDVYRLVSRHKIVKNRKEAIERSFNAGLDMNMAVTDLKAVDLMEELVDEGRITMERLDQAAGNVLKMKYRLGLFDNSPLIPERAISLSGSDKGKEIARQTVLESITLLKNSKELLPLKKTLKSILVTGERADTKRHLCGGWTLSWGSAEEEELHCLTILDGIRSKVSDETEITYISSPDQLASKGIRGRDYDVCISVVGEEPHSEWVGDTRDLALEPDEQRMLQAVADLGIPTVMVAAVGRPQQLVWADQTFEAILWAYVPGTEGAEPIADVLFGDYSPAGRLPVTFPKDANQIPITYDARKYVCDEMNTFYEPLYPFGFGMSYTTFRYSDLYVPESVVAGEDLEVEVTVENIGRVDSDTVVQLYLEDVYASVTRPFKSLKAFSKITLKAGEKKCCKLKVNAKELGLYDENLAYVIEEREIEVQIADLKKLIKVV